MNVIRSNWLCSLLIFAVGITFCFLYDRDNILSIIVYILGALFTTTGCINIIVTSMRHSRKTSGTFGSTIGWIAGLGGIGLGAALLLTPSTFTPILVYVFAGLLVLGGLWHFLVLSCYFKKGGMSGWLYFLPLVILVAGVVMFCSPDIRNNIRVSVLMSGIGAIIFSFTTLLEYIFFKHHEKALLKAETVANTPTSNTPVTVATPSPTPASDDKDITPGQPTAE